MSNPDIKTSTKWANQEDSSSEEGSLEEEEILKPSSVGKPAVSSGHSTVSADNRRSAYSSGREEGGYPSRGGPRDRDAGRDRDHGGRDRGASARDRPALPLRGTSSAPVDCDTILVANLSSECTEQQLHDLFTRVGNCKVKSVRISANNRGIAFVQLEDRASTLKALDAHGYSFLGLPIRVEISNKSDARREPPRRDAPIGGGGRMTVGRDGERRPVLDRPQEPEPAWGRKKVPPLPVAAVRRPVVEAPPPAPKPAPEPATRPKLELQPRSLPVDDAPAPPKVDSIFGSGRPRDQVLAEKVRTLAVLAAVLPYLA